MCQLGGDEKLSNRFYILRKKEALLLTYVTHLMLKTKILSTISDMTFIPPTSSIFIQCNTIIHKNTLLHTALLSDFTSWDIPYQYQLDRTFAKTTTKAKSKNKTFDFSMFDSSKILYVFIKIESLNLLSRGNSLREITYTLC